MQDTNKWVPPSGVLGSIIESTRDRIQRSLSTRRVLQDRIGVLSAPPSLHAALATGRGISVIAEVKRRSPSKGEINGALNAAELAKAYEESGASAISVLTEPTRFGGSLDDLASVSAAVGVAVIRKDFCLDELQLLEARAAGASAALLIARALPPARLLELAAAAAEMRLEVLIEVRSEGELRAALETGAFCIGVNNRNLETLDIDHSVSERILPLIPATHVAVYESGVRERADVEHASKCGADAVLVGSALSGAADPGELLLSLLGVARRGRDDAS